MVLVDVLGWCAGCLLMPLWNTPCSTPRGEAQSSFKLQQFLCSKGYAMDNPDEPQGIHLSLKRHPYLQSNSSVRACRIDDFSSASSACMQHTVCPTIHCYCNQALPRGEGRGGGGGGALGCSGSHLWMKTGCVCLGERKGRHCCLLAEWYLAFAGNAPREPSLGCHGWSSDVIRPESPPAELTKERPKKKQDTSQNKGLRHPGNGVAVSPCSAGGE